MQRLQLEVASACEYAMIPCIMFDTSNTCKPIIRSEAAFSVSWAPVTADAAGARRQLGVSGTNSAPFVPSPARPSPPSASTANKAAASAHASAFGKATIPSSNSRSGTSSPLSPSGLPGGLTLEEEVTSKIAYEKFHCNFKDCSRCFRLNRSRYSK